jgi:sulfoquinovosyltransferase
VAATPNAPTHALLPPASPTVRGGFVVLEAMASGLPIVAVRAGGIPDIVTDPGVTGLLYSPGDEAEAAAHVAELLGSEEYRARLGAAAREEVGRWDWRAATQHLVRVQYPLAMAAAAVYYGQRAARAAARDLGYGDDVATAAPMAA